MTLTPLGLIILGLAPFVGIACLCKRWLDHLDRKRRPISEHTDGHWYRPHTGHRP